MVDSNMTLEDFFNYIESYNLEDYNFYFKNRCGRVMAYIEEKHICIP